MDHDSVPATLRQLSRFLGTGLALACLGFIIWRFVQLAPQIARVAPLQSLLAGMALATLIYAAGGAFLAVAWWLLLRAFAGPSVSLSSAVRGHMRAQLAKYLPGNVFHFAARHAHARGEGLDHVNLASAAVGESVLLVALAISMSMTVPATAMPEDLQWLATWRGPIIAALLLGMLGVVYLLSMRGKLSFSDRIGFSFIPIILGATLCYLLFFAFAAMSFHCLLETQTLPAFVLLSTVAVCWLAGFLVVGAPGGLGVREAMLVGLLGPVLGETQALQAALTFRAVTILADIMVFLVGLLIPRPRAGNERNGPPGADLRGVDVR